MTANDFRAASPASLFRVDKFAVPPASMDAFLARVRRTHRSLGDLPGCLQNLVLQEAGGPGEFNIVTIVQWADAQAAANAKATMQARFAQEDFDAQAFMQALGVRGDLSMYKLLDPQDAVDAPTLA